MEAYRAFLEIYPVATVLLDPDGNVLGVNRSARALLEVDCLAEIEGQPLVAQIAEPQRDMVIGWLAGGDRPPMDVELVGARGKRSWVELSAGSAPAGAPPNAVVVALHDVTARVDDIDRLRATTELYRLIEEGSNDFITLRACDGTHVYGSPSFARLLGEHPAPSLELLLERFHPEDRAMGRQAWEEVAAGTSRMTTFRYRHADGKWHWLEAWGTRVMYRERPHVLSVSRDITPRKEAQEKLREREELYRFLAEGTNDVITLYDEQGRRVYVNPSFKRIFGQLPGDPFDAIHPDDLPRVESLWQRVLGGEHAFLHFRYRHGDGSWRWVETSVSPVIYRGTRHILAVARDVTERRTAEEEVLRRETHFRLLIENAADLILVVNHHGTIRSASPSAETMFGLTSAQLVGRNLLDLVDPADHPAISAALRDAAAKPMVPIALEHRVRRHDGERRVLHTVGRSVPGQAADGFIVLNSRDLTEHRLLEEQFRQSQKMEAIGLLAGGVAHDFNNVLGAIMLQAELAAEGSVTPEARESLQMIRGAAERGGNLTRQLLLFSRRQTTEPRDLNLNEIVTSLSRLLQRLIGDDVRLHLDLHPAPLPVHADPGMLDQVLLNLAINARDAMPQGGQVRIATSRQTVDPTEQRHPEAVTGDYAVLRVSDTGTGIAPEVLPRIFEPFFTTKEQGKGTGLGLATVFAIVKQHHGWIDVSSAPGAGATFAVFLPVNGAADLSACATTVPAARGGSETLLLVEDDEAVRLVSRAVLERAGYRVLESDSGADVLTRWPDYAGKVALMLTDLVMPGGISGYELAQRLQADRPGLPVIFVSGYSAEVAGHEVKLEPGRNFLQKPFTPDELLHTIRQALDEHGATHR